MAQLPEDITTLSDEEIGTLHNSIEEQFKAEYAGEKKIEVLGEFADALDVLRTEAAARFERAEQIAALAERVNVEKPVIEAVEVETEVEVTEEVTAETEAVIEAAEEIIQQESEVVEAEATEQERDLVTASADNTPKAPSASAVRAASPAVEAPAPTGPSIVITAAADIPGYNAGGELDRLALAKAMHAKARTLPDHSGRLSVATIDLNLEHKLGADMAYNLDVLDKVTAPSSLTASGWCAPSNNLYDLFAIEGNDGLIDLPTVQVTRGGLNVPDFISIGDAIENGGLWTWEETDQDNPEASKPCVEIPCPDFDDYRLVAEGICVTAGNLTDRAFPELTQRYVSLVLSAHLHRVSAAIINNISGSSTGVTMNAVDSSAAGSILHAIDLQVEDYKSQYRMGVNTVLEAIFPLWTKALIRADLAFRAGVALTNVTDADVDAHFASRKVRAQFVHDYQPLYSGNPAEQFPATLEFLLYPAGGYVRGDGGVIDLGVVRDSVLNATNDYTAAWTEQLYLVAKLGPAAREVTVSFGVDGVTGCCTTAS